MAEPIHLAFCLFERDGNSPYAMALAATYSSIRQRTAAVLHLHVICDASVGARTRQRLRRCLAPSDRLLFVSADDVPEAVALARRMDGRFSPAIIWRAWLPDYLAGVERRLLLDCDLQVLLDVHTLWQLDLGDTPLAAFQGGKRHPDAYYDWIQTPPDRYFRMGVCLMDLQAIRAHHAFITGRSAFLQEAARMTAQIKQAGLYEQSLFNRFFSAVYTPLPVDLVPANRLDQDPERRAQIHRRLKAHEPMILDLKGWLNHSEISLLFWSSLLHTPWWRRAARSLQLLRP